MTHTYLWLTSIVVAVVYTYTFAAMKSTSQREAAWMRMRGGK